MSEAATLTRDQIEALVREVTPVTLAACPIGMFLYNDELCLKTEYGNNEGRIDAYIVSSGEFFWGDEPQTIASQRKQLVVPVDQGMVAAAHDLAATALAYENLADRQQDEIARQIARAEAVEDALASERARREACEAALREARVLVEKWCYRQGNDPSIFQQYLGPIYAALNPASEGKP